MNVARFEVQGKWIRCTPRTGRPFNDDVKRFKAWGGRWSKARLNWSLPATASMAWRICKTYNEARNSLGRLAEQHYTRIEANKLKVSPVDIGPAVTRMKPWPHQIRAFDYVTALWNHSEFPVSPGAGAAGLYMDMGTGKTKVACDLIINQGFERVLVLAPKRVAVDVWPNEGRRHLFGDFAIELLEGTTRQRAKQMRELDDSKMTIVVVNYDSFWREPLFDEIQKYAFELIVTDEHHRLKGHTGKASKAVASLAWTIPYKLALTGTPIPHSPKDVFGEYLCLDPGIFGVDYRRFEERYTTFVDMVQYRMTTGYINEEELGQRVYSLAYRVTKEEAIELPPVMDVYRTYQLSKSTAAVYKELKDDFYVEVDAGEITASNALVASLRLRQLCSGIYKLDDNDEAKIVDTSKSEALREILEDLSEHEPVIIFATFSLELQSIRDVCSSLKRTYAELSGREDGLDRFRRGEASVLGVQLKTGGVGINLTRASYGIYYSKDWSLSDYEQSRARIVRPGQTRSVTFIHLQGEGTIEKTVDSALRAGKRVANEILMNTL